MTHLAGQFVFVQDMLLDVGVAHRVFVARLARNVGLVPHRCAHLSIAVHRRTLVTGHTRHLQLAGVDIAGDEIIVAKKFITDARAVTRGTRLFDRYVFADGMSGK